MAKYTKEAILQMAEEEDVEFIRLQFTDMFGMMKNMAITAGQLEKALNNQCVFDGSSFEGFVTIEEADMFLHPDLDTFAILPWHLKKQVIFVSDRIFFRNVCDGGRTWCEQAACPVF